MSVIYKDFPLLKSDVDEDDYISMTCDENDHILYIKYIDEFESWYQYDENGNLSKYKDCCGYKEEYSYDDDGNLLSYINSEGVHFTSEYDIDGNPIHFSDNNGYEEWYEYNEYGQISYFKNNERYEEWMEHDSKGNVVHYKNNNGVEELINNWGESSNVLRRDYPSDFTQVIVYNNNTGYTERYLDKPTYTVMRFNDYDKVGNVKHDMWNRHFKSYYRWYYYHYDYLAYNWGDRRYGFNQDF